MSDALTIRLPRPTFEKHSRDYLIGTRVPFSAFYAGMVNLDIPITAYVIKLPTPSKKDTLLHIVQVDNLSLTQRESEMADRDTQGSPKNGVALLL